MAKNDWGLMPEAVLAQLHRREWENQTNLKARLKGQKSFPLRLPLKPPRGLQAQAGLTHFHAFHQAWKNFNYAGWVEWQQKNYRNLLKQEVPAYLAIPDLDGLIEILGKTPQLRNWQHKISLLLHEDFVCESYEHCLFFCLIDHLDYLDRLNNEEWLLIVKVLSQLKKGMGTGLYLRALPLEYVDTKFLEHHLNFIEAICDVLHQGEIAAFGGLKSWLDCIDSPKGWLMVKPLCPEVQNRLGGLPIFQLSADVLHEFELPAQYIVVVENIQAGLALPKLKDSIVICGGGKNVAWLEAPWLQNKTVCYWGDIDSEGLYILSMVRAKLPKVAALMMDEATLIEFQNKMVNEPDSIFFEPEYLTPQELILFRNLRNNKFYGRRLEQERITNSWVKQHVSAWRWNSA